MKNLTKHLEESLRIGLNDSPELNIEDIHIIYRIDLSDQYMFLDIHEVNDLENHGGIARIFADNKSCRSLMYNGGNIPGKYKLVEEDGYMYENYNKSDIRLLFFPDTKDRFYGIFDNIYAKGGEGAKITINDICNILNIPSITNMISNYEFTSVTVQTLQNILNNINKYSETDK